ncbi:hypothetical protein BN946_scf185002.g17 [Trametes cinnabarina]|uniref:Transcription factor CBF/NF-Y/archaeal histone domain-containing protein n=1 Tax=Pycnoporus cinnabarinus TaxID=5643 RepID=A0A060SEE0_PYCCI|nr:hypothetical protein BN946_scf185002.g17 [Trametes cinnabarina]
MKAAVPPTAKISKEAKECVQECVSEFISFITSEAAEKCQMEKRKTIGGEDILYAMVTLGFENYAETLKIHLAKLRQPQSVQAGCQAGWLMMRATVPFLPRSALTPRAIWTTDEPQRQGALAIPFWDLDKNTGVGIALMYCLMAGKTPLGAHLCFFLTDVREVNVSMFNVRAGSIATSPDGPPANLPLFPVWGEAAGSLLEPQ